MTTNWCLGLLVFACVTVRAGAQAGETVPAECVAAREWVAGVAVQSRPIRRAGVGRDREGRQQALHHDHVVFVHVLDWSDRVLALPALGGRVRDAWMLEQAMNRTAASRGLA